MNKLKTTTSLVSCVPSGSVRKEKALESFYSHTKSHSLRHT